MPLIRKNPAPAEVDMPLIDHRRGLTDGSVDDRWMAARALTARGDVPLLAMALTKESDVRVREALLTTLASSGVAEGLDVIMALLRSDDSSARTGALDALRAMPDIITKHLPVLLRDEDPDVRLLVCELARGIPGVQAIGLLTERLEHDLQPNVCAAAVEVLAEVGTPDVLVALEACAARFPGEPFLVFATRAAADRIRSQPPARYG